MRIHAQPPQSTICGQCCVATLCDIPTAVVVSRFGKGRTTTKDVVKMLRWFGAEPATEALVPIVDHDKIPPLAILKIPWKDAQGRRGGHWVVFRRGAILDSARWAGTLSLKQATAYLPIVRTP